MKTKHGNKLIFIGIFLAMSAGSQIARGEYQGGPGILAFLIIAILAILSVGYGRKLKRLEKKGIKDTNETKIPGRIKS